MGMFTMHPNELGAGMHVLEDVTTLVEYCAAYRMGHLSMEQKFHMFISSAFSKEFRKPWQAAYREPPASTTGIEQNSKIYWPSSTYSQPLAARQTSDRSLRW